MQHGCNLTHCSASYYPDFAWSIFVDGGHADHNVLNNPLFSFSYDGSRLLGHLVFWHSFDTTRTLRLVKLFLFILLFLFLLNLSLICNRKSALKALLRSVATLLTTHQGLVQFLHPLHCPFRV